MSLSHEITIKTGDTVSYKNGPGKYKVLAINGIWAWVQALDGADSGIVNQAWNYTTIKPFFEVGKIYHCPFWPKGRMFIPEHITTDSRGDKTACGLLMGMDGLTRFDYYKTFDEFVEVS